VLRVLACVGFVSVLGCAGKLPPPGLPAPDPVGLPVRLVHGGRGGPAVARFVDAVYGPAFDVAAARELARAALAEAPGSSAAHEAAAYLAVLADDPHEAWLHFWKAAQDLDAPATVLLLYLREIGDGDLTRRELDATIDLYEALRAQHPDPVVRVEAADREAYALQDLDRPAQLRQVVDSVGYLTDWQIVGSFDNESGKGFLTAFPPEAKLRAPIDLAARMPGPRVEIGWQRLAERSRTGTIWFDNCVSPVDDAVAYLAGWVHVDRAADAQLRIGTGSPARAWLNGGLVASDEHITGGSADALVVPVRLQAGWNQLLIKSAHKQGSWWMKVRFSDRTGAPLPGLRAATSAQPFAAQPDAQADADPLPAALQAVQPEARRQALTGRFLWVNGRYEDAVGALRPFIDGAPHNLLAMLLASLAHWDNEETGQAIDLLNAGVKQAAGAAPAFLHRRAQYYRQRGLYDKAQADYLNEIDHTAVARTAERDLADLFGDRGWRAERCQLAQKTAEKWPDSAETWLAVARCQDALDYDAGALAALQRAEALRPSDLDTLELLFHRALDRADFAEAHRRIDALLAASPNAVGYLVSKAELARRERSYAEAERLLRAVAATAPVWSRPHEKLGDLFWEQGRSADAIAEWKLALARDPDNANLAQRIELHQPTRLGFIERFLPGDETIERVLREPLTPARGARVARRLDDEVTDVNADGSAVRVVTRVDEALNEHGRDELIAQALPSAGQLKILQAYSLSKRGDRQEASSITGGHVRFRNLEVGSRVVVQYVVYQPPSQFLQNEYIATDYVRLIGVQVEESRWVLCTAAERALHVHQQGPIALDEQVVGGRRVRTWTARQVPPLLTEPLGPPAGDVLWRIDVSTVPDWQDYVRWELALFTDARRGSPQIDALADRLTAGATTAREKLTRLQRYLMHDIRYQQDYENTIAGIRPHPGPVVLERGYGDCKDKAALFIQLAARAGVKLRYALLRVAAAGKLIADVPNQQFNHAIVYVPVQPGIDKAYFMDPTPDALDLGNLPPDDQGTTSLVVDPETGAWEMVPIPYQASADSYGRAFVRVDVKSPSQARVTAQVSYRGYIGAALRHLLRDRTQAEKTLQAYAGELLPGATLIGFKAPAEEDLGTPLAMDIELDGARSIRERDDAFRLPLPRALKSSLVSLDKRETPLRLGAPFESSSTVELSLPDGYAFLHLPPDFAMDHPCVSIRRHVVAAGRTATVSDQVRTSCAEIAPDDYPALRDKLRDADSRLSDEITFGKAPNNNKAPPRAVTSLRRAAAR
jgi:transglutaminase-like putative cysteine protease/tetratricopeptide (TPR) repeat protein